MIFTGIAVLLGVSLLLSSSLHIRVISKFSGCEGRCGEPYCAHPAFRTPPLLPQTSEQLHWSLTHQRVDGVARKDYGTTTFHPRAFDQGNEGRSNEWVQCV